jgi:hypothetical protein
MYYVVLELSHTERKNDKHNRRINVKATLPMFDYASCHEDTDTGFKMAKNRQSLQRKLFLKVPKPSILTLTNSNPASLLYPP